MPTARQIETTRAVVGWYLGLYYGSQFDLGGPATFTDRRRVGWFAAAPSAFERGDPAALFRVFIAMTLFQRRQDQQVFRILRGIAPTDGRQLADLAELRRSLLGGRCRMLQSSRALHCECDLAKVPGTTYGTCGVAPATVCHLKRHTILLKRYGHFGKVPTSAALMLSEAGVKDLRALRRKVFAESSDPRERATLLEAALMRVWRVHRKIASMFLSAVCNPDLGPPRPPWQHGIDWTRFVVIDSNTDLFLDLLRYRGLTTYDARMRFISELAARIDLSRIRHGLAAFNPRLVQQAMYMFMSRTNRGSSLVDCIHVEGACSVCPQGLAAYCPVRAQNRIQRSRPTGPRGQDASRGQRDARAAV